MSGCIAVHKLSKLSQNRHRLSRKEAEREGKLLPWVKFKTIHTHTKKRKKKKKKRPNAAFYFSQWLKKLSGSYFKTKKIKGNFLYMWNRWCIGNNRWLWRTWGNSWELFFVRQHYIYAQRELTRWGCYILNKYSINLPFYTSYCWNSGEYCFAEGLRWKKWVKCSNTIP